MDKQPPSTEQIFNQLGTDRTFTGGRGRLAPYSPEELTRLEQDRAKAAKQEAARWAANTAILEARGQLSAQPDNVVSITEAPSYVEQQPAVVREQATERQG